MCSALEEKVKCQHKLCIWDKKNELVLQAVKVRELSKNWTARLCSSHAPYWQGLLCSPVSPLCLTVSEQEGRDDKDRSMKWMMCKEGCLRWYRMKTSKQRKVEKFVHFWNSYQLLQVTDSDRQLQVSLPTPHPNLPESWCWQNSMFFSCSVGTTEVQFWCTPRKLLYFVKTDKPWWRIQATETRKPLRTK